MSNEYDLDVRVAMLEVAVQGLEGRLDALAGDALTHLSTLELGST